MQVRARIPVRVWYYAGAYVAMIRRARGTSTCDQETAIRRAVERYLKGSSLRVVSLERDGGPDERGRELWWIELA
ncbi:hypothetical protein [Pelomicrobium methylotrophicum]|uniref:Uncharacterized protein n=1 Tax=Pelomicrobium methylotrophicum TaxID=2602750 RepID=A0A5C7EXU3_9PROT|nr:hypothetical protein [Pelomicrobium methylotrophicum]TXF11903.1 hypothetical protein FR698_07820 [Pelomicrobium methylotrophicum]